MKFLIKFEDALNNILTILLSKLAGVFFKIVPKSVFDRFCAPHRKLMAFFGKLKHRKKVEATDTEKLPLGKQVMALVKEMLMATMNKAAEVYKEHKKESKTKAILKTAMAPWIVFKDWTSDLSKTQFMALFSFTTASFFSVVAIFMSTQNILHKEHPVAPSRAPASIEVTPNVDEHPDYKKMQECELTFTNLRLPIYDRKAEKFRAIVIDFSVHASNLATKEFLKQSEFEIRDHLIHEVESTETTFPMNEEGKTIIVEKIQSELNIYLANHHIEGKVVDTRLTYVLGH